MYCTTTARQITDFRMNELMKTDNLMELILLICIGLTSLKMIKLILKNGVVNNINQKNHTTLHV